MKEKIVTRCLEGVLYILAALGLFYGFLVLSSDLQDFSHWNYIVPIVLAYWSPVYLLFAFHILVKNAHTKRAKGLLCGNGIALGLLGLLGMVWVLTNVIRNVYHTFFQGIVSPLFPFDIFAIFVFEFIFGLMAFIESHLMKDSLDSYLQTPTAGRGWRGFFWAIFVLIALYHFGAFLFGLGFAYYTSPTFGLMMPLYLLMLLQTGMVLYEEWIKKGSLKTRRIVALSLLGTAAVLSSLMLLFNLVDPYYLVENGTAYYPLDWLMSLDLAPFLACLPPLIASLAFLVAKDKAKKAA